MLQAEQVRVNDLIGKGKFTGGGQNQSISPKTAKQIQKGQVTISKSKKIKKMQKRTGN